ncbi:ABC transporter ATP-binding protein [Candidatus Cyanaurora vandensis]|uniref:ABC transporter ATP-binding protein n=1 Tax=Candidatus Cyanaurora vandensis TaxID=2714958 RepID=UPI00257AEF7E|nr:ABC transporter ATP-binding protein [Candidatus Cyanaurora vandensis]
MAGLQIEGLCAGYGPVPVLHEVSLAVQPGEIVTVIGPNGAGKSTTLRTISGLLKAEQGRITFNQEDIQGVGADVLVGRGIVQVPEGRRIFSKLTVLENLEMGAYSRRDAIGADLARVFILFPILKQRQDQKAGTLSGGEQQMLAMGRALLAKPKLLLLDEPSMGLAPLIVQDIFRIIKQIQETGVMILLVEQNARQALKLADRGYVLEDGHILMAGEAKELLNSAAVRKSYLGESL